MDGRPRPHPWRYRGSWSLPRSPSNEDRGTPIAVRQLLEAFSRLGHHVDLLTYSVGRPFEVPRLPGDPCRQPARLSARADRAFAAQADPRLPAHGRAAPAALARFLRLRPRRRGGGLPRGLVREAARDPRRLRHAVEPAGAAQRPFPLQRPPLSWLVRRAERWLLEHSDFVVASSGLSERVRRIAPGNPGQGMALRQRCSVGQARRILETLRTLQIPKGAPVVLYTGTFEPYQGLPDLLDAMPRVVAAVPKAQFLLVGGTGRLPEDQVAGVRKWLDNGTLHLVPRQPRNRIPGFFAIADVVVSGRKFGSNIPLKIFDYLPSGRPIVATDIAAHRAILDSSRAVLVPRPRKASPTASSRCYAILPGARYRRGSEALGRGELRLARLLAIGGQAVPRGLRALRTGTARCHLNGPSRS